MKRDDEPTREMERRVRHHADVLQFKCHRPGSIPNHLFGIPSRLVAQGPSIVTRQEANEESW